MNTDSLIKSGIVLFAGIFTYFVVGMLLRHLIHRAMHSGKHAKLEPIDTKKREDTLLGLFNTMWKVTVVMLTLMVILRNIFPSVDLSPIFASAGIIGVAIGFGSQSLVKDLLSGIFIISDNQFRIGDVVEIDMASGTVERIGARSTVLRDLEGNVHYIPNGMIQHVINKTMGYGVTRLMLAISPGSDIELVTNIINETGIKISESDKWKDKILEAPAFSHIAEITGTYITIVVSGKTQTSEQWAVTAEMRKRLFSEFEKAGIKLAKQTLRSKP